MKKSELEIIVGKYSVSQALRAELEPWAFGNLDHDATRTLFSDANFAMDSFHEDEVVADSTMLLNTHQAPSTTKVENPKITKSVTNLLTLNPNYEVAKVYEDLGLLVAG